MYANPKSSTSRTCRILEDAKPRTFEEVILVFLKHSKIHKRSHQDDVCRARTLHSYFAGTNLTALTSVQVSGYAAQRLEAGLSHATINRELMLLSAAISHAQKTQGWELPNPIRPCLLTEPPGRVRWLSKPDAQRLIQAARRITQAPYLADFILLALHTGCRSGELFGLEWSRVDLARSILLLEAQHTKTARSAALYRSTAMH